MAYGHVPNGYPRPGTAKARVLECLEAESASTDEIAQYVGATLGTTKFWLHELKRDGIVRLIGYSDLGYSMFELVDPISISILYSTDIDT